MGSRGTSGDDEAITHEAFTNSDTGVLEYVSLSFERLLLVPNNAHIGAQWLLRDAKKFMIDDHHEKHLQEQENNGYVLTLSSKILLKDHWTFPLGFAGPALLKPWQSFSVWLKGGDGDGDGDSDSTIFEAGHGKSLWNHEAENVNEFCSSFNEAMAADSRVVLSVLVSTEYEAMSEGVTSLVDVGGGNEKITWKSAIAEAFPNIKCSVLELPHVVASCQGSENLEFVAGDMFLAIPYAEAIILFL
ncbi:hypothetical protein Syun_008610 [Stephania yunnanensis]|uniref:O-methyltransferase C-terminal domain-containing protein n=1 Tax=Stephania yunnanensis TaxID=152371 RepID=A0AAP0KCW9_9MAGN